MPVSTPSWTETIKLLYTRKTIHYPYHIAGDNCLWYSWVFTLKFWVVSFKISVASSINMWVSPRRLKQVTVITSCVPVAKTNEINEPGRVVSTHDIRVYTTYVYPPQCVLFLFLFLPLSLSLSLSFSFLIHTFNRRSSDRVGMHASGSRSRLGGKGVSLFVLIFIAFTPPLVDLIVVFVRYFCCWDPLHSRTNRVSRRVSTFNHRSDISYTAIESVGDFNGTNWAV